MKQIRIEIALNNTPDVPPFNGVQIQLRYDPKVLTGSSLDYSTNVLSQTGLPTALLRNCLDGNGAGGNSGLCGTDDGPGITSFAETILGGTTPDGTSGNIFFLTFNVNTTAPSFSQIRVAGDLRNGSKVILTTNLDGSYTSLNCGGQPCVVSRPNFTWSPLAPTQGKVVVFYANSSVPGTGKTIKDYFWFFGDQANFPYHDGGTNSTVSYIYNLAGTFTVTLTITDNSGFKTSKSLLIKVINAIVDMGFISMSVEPNPLAQNPGVVFNVTAVLRNYGGLPENTSISISITINGKSNLLGNFTAINVKPSTERNYSVKWNSTGAPPNVYRVDAITPILKNETLADTGPNLRSVWIQLILVQPNGSLSLLSTAGLSVLVLGAGGAGVSFIRKKTRKTDDLL